MGRLATMVVTDVPQAATPAGGAVRDDRNTTLDTLRALAILLVMCAHTVNSYGLPNRWDFMGFGGAGVDLFFCLSGWLLGRQLLIEFRDTGRINVPRFWMRRWMRTLPAYFAVLFATVGQSIVQGKMPTWWPYLFFLQNYLGMPFFGISWSLCVEEYFYLLVAPLLYAISRRRQWLPFIVVLLLIPFASRALMPWVNATWGWHWDRDMTHLRYDQCAVGVLLAAIAVLTTRAWNQLARIAPALCLVSLGLASLNVLWRVTDRPVADWSPMTWTIIFSSFVLLANSNDFWRKRATVPGARYVANRAYALYLLHPEGIATANRVFGLHDGRPNAPLLLWASLAWLVAFIAAEVLYRVIERPFMRAREWFHISRASHQQAHVAVV